MFVPMLTAYLSCAGYGLPADRAYGGRMYRFMLYRRMKDGSLTKLQVVCRYGIACHYDARGSTFVIWRNMPATPVRSDGRLGDLARLW